jgi:DNA-binding IscR family transcriptional regulator
MHQLDPTNATESALPASLTSPRAKLVYLYVATHGEASLDELSDDLGMQKLTLYSVIETLRSRGLLRGRDGGYRLT